MKILLLGLLLTLGLLAQARAAKPEVTVTRGKVDDMAVFEVKAGGTVQAPPAAVWKILTNYERMPEFVPDLNAAKVVSRNGNEVIVEQHGVARFFFLSQDIHLVVRVLEQPMSAIDIGLVAGDMKYYSCRWELVPVPETGGTRVIYTGKLVPKFAVPALIGGPIIHHDIARMMEAVLKRLDEPVEAQAK